MEWNKNGRVPKNLSESSFFAGTLSNIPVFGLDTSTKHRKTYHAELMRRGLIEKAKPCLLALSVS